MPSTRRRASLIAACAASLHPHSMRPDGTALALVAGAGDGWGVAACAPAETSRIRSTVVRVIVEGYRLAKGAVKAWRMIGPTFSPRGDPDEDDGGGSSGAGRH